MKSFEFEGRIVTADYSHGASSCKGCILRGEHSRRCKAISRAAQDAGLPDCDDASPTGAYVYVLVPDPRQMDLIETYAASTA